MKVWRWTGRALAILLALGGVFLFGFLVYLSGPKEVLRQLVSVGWAGFLAAWGSVLLGLLFWAMSWSALLRGAGLEVPFRRLFSPLLAGFAITYITPSAYLGGEPVRAYWVAKDHGFSMTQVMATVVVERLLAGVAVLLFFSVGGVLVLTQPGVSSADKYAIALGLGTMAFFILLGVWAVARKAHWLSSLLRALGRLIPMRGWLARAAAKVAETEAEIHQAFTYYLPFTVLSFLFQLLGVLVTYLRPQLFFYFTQRALFSFAELSLYFTLSTFINAFLWISPGGLGLTDGGRVGVFTLLGVPASAGMAFNVVFRLAETLTAGLGVMLLVRRGLLHIKRGRVQVPVEKTPKEG